MIDLIKQSCFLPVLFLYRKWPKRPCCLSVADPRILHGYDAGKHPAKISLYQIKSKTGTFPTDIPARRNLP